MTRARLGDTAVEAEAGAPLRDVVDWRHAALATVGVDLLQQLQHL